ncbi:class I fructose-bisphosphate aldolase [Thermopolyspora sp. NPDC052614]|uniref:class I fructose-bisphosphate aldolase n=1 Tax=Thermopolyspora sp. NPDC052614 TaxID=3155682 RepID=UPI00342E4CFC
MTDTTDMNDIARVAAAMVAPPKGILAADESIRTMSDRLLKAGVAPTEENRRDYRELLVTTPGLSEGVSGVILCDETFNQRLSDGRTFPEAIAEAGMLPGIKVDTGAKPLANAPGETVTEGLDGLRERLVRYAALGARFAKWRAVFSIGDGIPSRLARRANAHALARYAALCQEAGVVPIVEPEVLMDGRHPMSRCASATSVVLLEVFAELMDAEVRLDAIVLKPNMVLPGKDWGGAVTAEGVARSTVSTLRNVVPEEVAGVAFLSGGQTPAEATANLAAIRKCTAPWPLTFSFGRALVDPALAAWSGRQDRVPDAQRALAKRVALNSGALTGAVPAEAVRD